MKINRFFALAVIALLAVGAMGALKTGAFAQSGQPSEAQSQVAASTDTEQAANAPDTDQVQEQVGEQVEDGLPDGSEGAEAPETEGPGEPDSGPDVQEPSYSGSIAVNEAQYEGMSEADESAALQGLATISAFDAEAAALAANPGTSVIKTELDNENGALVYSVELSNGADVKVDAGNAAILFTDTGGGFEG